MATGGMLIGFADGGTHPAITFTDTEERECMALKVDSKKGASIGLIDKNRHARLILFSGLDGPSGLGFMSAIGAARKNRAQPRRHRRIQYSRHKRKGTVSCSIVDVISPSL